VLVIDSDGTKLGVIPTQQALMRAKDQGLNLVEVAPNVRPPVCKILDYGKYKYDQKQDAKRKKKNQVTVEIKEVKWRPKVDKHDFEFKMRHVIRFLREGNKVKGTIMFRGREMAHPEIGKMVLDRVLAALEGKVIVENEARLEGRNMSMQIAPKPNAFEPLPKQEAAAAKGKKKDAEPEVDLDAELEKAHAEMEEHDEDDLEVAADPAAAEGSPADTKISDDGEVTASV
jgi:translation initiation factor IF-3